jgi:hypothetical protein
MAGKQNNKYAAKKSDAKKYEAGMAKHAKHPGLMGGIDDHGGMPKPTKSAKPVVKRG